MDKHSPYRVGNITSRSAWMFEYERLADKKRLSIETGGELKTQLLIWLGCGMFKDAPSIKESLETLTEISDNFQNPVVKASARALLEEVWG